MDLISKNIIPGNYGKIFGTNAIEKDDLLKIKRNVLKIPGVKEVKINMDSYPKEFTVYTSSLIRVEDIEDEVKKTGYHAIPKNLFEI